MARVTINGALQALKREKIATLTASTGLTAATYDYSTTTGTSGAWDKTNRPIEAMVQVETAAIRWTTVVGATPTTTASTGVGFTAQAGDFIALSGHDAIVNFRAINEVASSGAGLSVEYYYQ